MNEVVGVGDTREAWRERSCITRIIFNLQPQEDYKMMCEILHRTSYLCTG
jgi:hypothetical protein